MERELATQLQALGQYIYMYIDRDVNLDFTGPTIQVDVTIYVRTTWPLDSTFNLDPKTSASDALGFQPLPPQQSTGCVQPKAGRHFLLI